MFGLSTALFLIFFLCCSLCAKAAKSAEFIKMKDWQIQGIGKEKMVLTCM